MKDNMGIDTKIDTKTSLQYKYGAMFMIWKNYLDKTRCKICDLFAEQQMMRYEREFIQKVR